MRAKLSAAKSALDVDGAGAFFVEIVIRISVAHAITAHYLCSSFLGVSFVAITAAGCRALAAPNRAAAACAQRPSFATDARPYAPRITATDARTADRKTQQHNYCNHRIFKPRRPAWKGKGLRHAFRVNNVSYRLFSTPL